MAGQPVRIGVIGTGNNGQGHIKRLQQITEAQIVALCDVDEAKARSVAGPIGDVPVYTDGSRMIEEAQIDALYVSVPPDQYGDYPIQAARKGVHLFVEKPLNRSLEQAMKTADAIRESGVLSQSGYVFRYQPSTVQLKRLLEEHPVGTANAVRWSGMPDMPWWPKYERCGGQLYEMTTHQVDLLRWVMGEVEAVSASYSFNRLFADMPGVTVPDSQTAILHFRSGASATVNTSCALGGATYRGDMEFVVRNARVIWQADKLRVEPDGAYELPPAPKEFINIDEAFVRAVATGDRSLLKSPYDDALQTVAVTLAANRSAEEGGRLVRVDEMLGK